MESTSCRTETTHGPSMFICAINALLVFLFPPVMLLHSLLLIIIIFIFNYIVVVVVFRSSRKVMLSFLIILYNTTYLCVVVVVCAVLVISLLLLLLILHHLIIYYYYYYYYSLLIIIYSMLNNIPCTHPDHRYFDPFQRLTLFTNLQASGYRCIFRPQQEARKNLVQGHIRSKNIRVPCTESTTC